MIKRLIWDKNKYPLDFFGIPTSSFEDSSLYDDLIFNQHRKNNMIDELNLGVRYKKFTYKGKIKVDYDVNQYGYRGPELAKVDLLTSGCSQSFGVGVPEDLTWPHMLAIKNSLSYNNLSYPGNSTMAMVEDVFKYFNLFGHPKHLRLLVPDFLRFKFIKAANENVFIQNSRGNIGEFLNTVSDADRSMLKYEKLPIAIEKIMPTSVPFRSNLFAIKMLEQYVAQTDIDFKWATWHNELNVHFNKHDYKFKNYVQSKVIEDYDYKNCHQDIKQMDPRFFDVGTDPQEHMGSHAHAHYAELFAIDKI
jgi:hypothetical protein